MPEINTDPKNLKKFGFTMFIALLIAATILFLKHKNGYFALYCLAVLFFLAGSFYARSLKPVYTAWMKLTFVLSWINTRILLSIIFYLVLTPIGLILKMFTKKRLLDNRIDVKKTSYWEKNESAPNIADFERQF